MDLKIDCSVRTECRASGHVEAVKMGGSTYTVQHVYRLKDSGHEVFTESPDGSRFAVEEWHCSCGQPTLRSPDDAPSDADVTQITCPESPKPVRSRMPPPQPRTPW